MRFSRSIVATALLAAVPVVALAAAQAGPQKPKTVSTKDFAIMLATATGARSADAAAATEALARTGVSLGKDFSAPLTERQLAQVLDHYGVNVRQTTSDRPVSPGKAEAAVLLVSNSLAAGRGDANAGSTAPAPSSIDDCAMLDNPGQCVNCCKALGIHANNCHRTCYQIHKESPSEPLP